jgi:hypothetical protein
MAETPPPEQPTNQDLRAYPRRTVMRRAAVLLSPTQEIECTIKNVSRNGAMIELDQPFALPKRFVLDMSGNIVVRRLCDLVWQDELHAGVNFAKLRGIEAVQFNLP